MLLDGGILHRDISLNNIIMTNPKEAGGFSGMLIDLDLAVRVDKAGKNEQTEAHAMTGTLEFIAIELLEATLNTETRRLEHTYRHDLESFFYVFLSVCVRYGWNKEPKHKNAEEIARRLSGRLLCLCIVFVFLCVLRFLFRTD